MFYTNALIIPLEAKIAVNLEYDIRSHTLLIGNDAGIRKQPGTKLQNNMTGEIIYTPPEHIDMFILYVDGIDTFFYEKRKHGDQ